MFRRAMQVGAKLLLVIGLWSCGPGLRPEPSEPARNVLAENAGTAEHALCASLDGAGGWDFPDAGGGFVDSRRSMCISSNECGPGYYCSDFGRCEPIPQGNPDGGMPPPPPEVEYDFGEPISSGRYIYVAMTAQDELARIDGQTLVSPRRQVTRALGIRVVREHEFF